MMSAIRIWWADGHPLAPYRWTHKNGGFDLAWFGHALNLWHRYTRWFRPSFWYWALKDNEGPRNIWCRLHGHPHGTVYYNLGGYEPDNHCADCGELIG